MLEFQTDAIGNESQFLVDVLNKFLHLLPEKDAKGGLRLALQILETADVARHNRVEAPGILGPSRWTDMNTQSAL